tara:strand:+ start:1537 stop:1743 length:207 start_codon:yes stop_codon:yes gene_type:complete
MSWCVRSCPCKTKKKHENDIDCAVIVVSELRALIAFARNCSIEAIECIPDEERNGGKIEPSMHGSENS